MAVTKFTILTALGFLPWVAVLGYAGDKLGQNWDVIKYYTRPLLYAVIAIVVIFIVFNVYKHRKTVQ